MLFWSYLLSAGAKSYNGKKSDTVLTLMGLYPLTLETNINQVINKRVTNVLRALNLKYKALWEWPPWEPCIH